MKSLRCLPLCLLLPAACGDPAGVWQTADGRYRVVAECGTDDLHHAIAQQPSATSVVALDGDWRRVLRTVDEAARKPTPFTIATGPRPTDDEPICDAVVTPDTGARAALELAVLAARGVDVPRSKVAVGVMVTTPENRAAGGTRRVAPGDAFLAMLRAQHGTLLGPRPDDSRATIGLLAAGDAPQALVAEVRASARTATSFVLLEPHDNEPPTAFRTRLAARGPASVIVVGDPATLKEGDLGELPTIVLDRRLDDARTFCQIACPPSAVGRAIADEVRRLLPEGGALLLCGGADDLREAFATALGLQRTR